MDPVTQSPSNSQFPPLEKIENVIKGEDFRKRSIQLEGELFKGELDPQVAEAKARTDFQTILKKAKGIPEHYSLEEVFATGTRSNPEKVLLFRDSKTEKYHEVTIGKESTATQDFSQMRYQSRLAILSKQTGITNIDGVKLDPAQIEREPGKLQVRLLDRNNKEMSLLTVDPKTGLRIPASGSDLKPLVLPPPPAIKPEPNPDVGVKKLDPNNLLLDPEKRERIFRVLKLDPDNACVAIDRTNNEVAFFDGTQNNYFQKFRVPIMRELVVKASPETLISTALSTKVGEQIAEHYSNSGLVDYVRSGGNIPKMATDEFKRDFIKDIKTALGISEKEELEFSVRNLKDRADNPPAVLLEWKNKEGGTWRMLFIEKEGKEIGHEVLVKLGHLNK